MTAGRRSWMARRRTGARLSTAPQQLHLDLAVDDLDEAVRLGARRAAVQPAPDRWRVFRDPAGHPFGLSLQIPE